MEENLSQLFRQLNVSHRIVVQAYLDQYGLYIGQPRFLFALARRPGMSQVQLSNELKVSKETVSVAMRRLEQVGYVSREASLTDKRIKLLSLSDKGEVLMPELKEHFNGINDRMFSLLDHKEKELLESLFKKMIQGIEKELG